MKLEELKISLSALKDKVLRYESAEKKLQTAVDLLEMAENYHPSRLDRFDETHKDQFIIEKCGKRPKVKIWKLKEYDAKAEAATKDYYATFSDERSKRRLQDKEDKEERLSSAKAEKDSAKWEFDDASLVLSSDDLLPKRFWNSALIDSLIQALDEGKADCRKDLLNLGDRYLFEQEQMKLMKENQEAVEDKLTKMEELINEAIETAESAESSADEALRLIREIQDDLNSSESDF